MTRPAWRILAGLVLLAGGFVQADDAASFEDVISLKTITGTPAISPDGESILFSVRRADWDQNRYETDIWIARRGATPHRMISGVAGPPIWSPDNEWFAFTKAIDGKSQLHAMRASGGESVALTSGAEPVRDFSWRPEGLVLGFTRGDEQRPAEKSRKDEYGAFVVEGVDLRMSHLWIIDVEERLSAPPEVRWCSEKEARDETRTCARKPEPQRLTSGAFTVMGFEWSPDGELIAIVRSGDPRTRGFVETDIDLVDVDEGSVDPPG